MRHTVFVLILLPLVSSAWQSVGSPAPPCLAVGQMSGSGTVDQALSLKSDEGSYSNLLYDRATVFTDGKTNMSLLDLDVDDRLCVEAYRNGPGSPAARVRVTRRSQLDERNREDLMKWDGDSFFGTVKSLDIPNGTIVLHTASDVDVQIDAAAPASFWTLPAEATDPSDAAPADWRKLAPGDELFVRGHRTSEAEPVRARVMATGGFRVLAGSVESMEPLISRLGLREFRSNGFYQAHFEFMPIYVVAKDNASNTRGLKSGDLGDVDVHDSVVLVGRQDARTGTFDAWLLVSGFMRRGIALPDGGESPDWILKALGLGTRHEAIR